MVTTVIKTVGTASRDYSTLQAWEDAAPSDLTLTRSATTVTGSTSSTIMLDALASATNEFYTGHPVWANARSSEIRLITAYNGTTKVATIGAFNGSSATWTNTPTVEAYTIDACIWQGQAYNDSVFTAILTAAGSTASATCYKHLTAAAGQSFSDNSAVALRYNEANGVAISYSAGYATVVTLSENYSRITRFQIKTANLSEHCLTVGGTGTRADQMILYGSNASSNPSIIETGDGTFVTNSLLYKKAQGSTQYFIGNSRSTFVNCTIANLGSVAGIAIKNYYSGSSAVNRNLAVFGCTTAADVAAATSQTNYTDQASPVSGYTGSIAFSTAQFTNITSGSEDFRLVSGSALLDVGTTDATNAATDIVGTARPQGSAYDVGAWEYVSSAPGIAFDAASNSGYQPASAGYTWSHTCTGANRYLTVGVSLLSIVQTVTGITYNSVAMTFLGAQNSITGAARIELWGLIAPSTGANTISVSLSGSIASAGNASSYTGVHQTFPAEAWNSAFATNVGVADATVNVTTVADNDWTVDIIAADDGSITVGTGQTQTGNVTGAGGSGAMSYKGPKTPAGSVTMYWTNVGAAQTWCIGSIALRPLSSADQFFAKAYKYIVAAIRGSY